MSHHWAPVGREWREGGHFFGLSTNSSLGFAGNPCWFSLSSIYLAKELTLHWTALNAGSPLGAGLGQDGLATNTAPNLVVNFWVQNPALPSENYGWRSSFPLHKPQNLPLSYADPGIFFSRLFLMGLLHLPALLWVTTAPCSHTAHQRFAWEYELG